MKITDTTSLGENMKIYELIGWTARVDWASSSHRVSLGLFLSEEKAKAKMTSIKSSKDWYMDWEDDFTIEEKIAIA